MHDRDSLLKRFLAQALEKSRTDAQCRCNIFNMDRLGRMVTDSAGRPEEDHRCGHVLRNDHRIMTRPAHYVLWIDTNVDKCFFRNRK